MAWRAFSASPSSTARAVAAWWARLSSNQPSTLSTATTNTVLRAVSIAPREPCSTRFCVASNAYAEPLLRTAKYRPEFPAKGFASLDEARVRAAEFVR